GDVAERAGCTTKVLLQCGLVSRHIGEGELERFLGKRTAYGQPLGWSHLVALCSVTSRRRREMLLDQWLAKPTTGRAFVAELRAQREAARQALRRRPASDPSRFLDRPETSGPPPSSR